MSRGFRPILTAVVLTAVAFALNACDDQEQALVSAGQSELLPPTTPKKDVADQALPDGGHDRGVLNWSAGEKALLDTLSIKHLDQLRIDPSNRYQTHPQAISFGSKLFFDPRLSDNGKIACSTCHQPDTAFSDGLPQAQGVRTGTRNTPSLLGVSHQQWLFWDGRKDSVWSQALGPLENPDEHNLTRVSLIHKLFAIDQYRQDYAAIFGHPPSAEELASWPEQAAPNGSLKSLKLWKSLTMKDRKRINRIVSNIGKALAAYESTLAFPVSRFDQFLGQLNAASPVAAEPALSIHEQQGLKLFIGKGACISCHLSPLLSNQSFQNIGTGTPGKDMGRSQVAEAQRWDEFNCLGEYSDAPKDACKDLQYMNSNRHDMAGSFKVPSLRNVSKTAPYMHDGRFQTLMQVVAYYSNPPNQAQTGHHLPPIQLNETEQALLTEFLNAL